MSTALYILGGTLLIIVGVVLTGGALISREHTATRAADFARPASEVWDAITNVAEGPNWRTGLTRVEMLDPAPGDTRPRWAEHSRHGKMTMMFDSQSPPSKVVTRIADDSLPFGGTWTFQLEPTATGCRLRITENGIIKPPPFRFIAKFFMGYASTMEQYLRDLGKRFGQNITIEN